MVLVLHPKIRRCLPSLPRPGMHTMIGLLRRVPEAAMAFTLVGCGATTSDDSKDGGIASILDGGPAPDGSFHQEGGVDDATADGVLGTDTEQSDVDASATCGEIEDAAQQQFGPIVQQNVACSEDTDCVWTPSDQGGWCVAPCGWLSNQAGVAAVQSAANILCEPFLAHGCLPPFLGCPYFGTFICAGGTCASYHFWLTPYPLTLMHGVCTALQLNYGASAGSPNAPRNLVVSITASDGTLYSDAECTTLLTTGSLTIPSGSSSVAFGFTATAPGSCSLDLGPQGLTYSLTVQ
jgi:hypothetical protein